MCIRQLLDAKFGSFPPEIQRSAAMLIAKLVPLLQPNSFMPSSNDHTETANAPSAPNTAAATEFGADIAVKYGTMMTCSLSIYLSIYLSMYLSMYLSIQLSIPVFSAYYAD